MSARVAVISGSDRGSGRATAKGLARAGFDTVLLCRTMERARRAADELTAETRLERFLPAAADLSDPRAIGTAADEILARFSQVHLVVNHARIARRDFRRTDEGIEETLAVNHVARVRLTAALLPGLLRGRGTRIVNVVSGTPPKGFRPEVFDGPEDWTGRHAAAQTRLLGLVHTFDLARLLQGRRIAVNAVEGDPSVDGLPGGSVLAAPIRRFGRMIGRSPERGARTTLRVATDPILTGVTGEYFRKNERAVPPQIARDPEITERARAWSGEVAGVDWAEAAEAWAA